MADRYRAFVDPASGGQVAVSFDANSDAIQHMHVVGSGGGAIAGVDSLAGGPAVRVTQAGSLTAWTVASIAGQPTVTASVPGTVGVTQSTSPWITQAASTGAPQGTVVASVPGTVTTVTSVIGQPTVTASVPGQVTVTASVPGVLTVTGSVEASQAGAWSVTADSVTGQVGVLQVTSPWGVSGLVTASVIGQPTVTASVSGVVPVVGSVGITQADTTQPLTVYVVSQGGGGSTITGSVYASQVGAWTVDATQGTSPWITQAASTGAPQGTMVASVIGQVMVTASVAGIPTVTGSVHITQADTTQPLTVYVVSQGGGGSTISGSVFASQVGSWASFLVGGATGLLAGVSSYGGDGPLLRVDLVRGSLSAGADGAIVDGADSLIRATVTSHAAASALHVIVDSTAGGGSTITGSVWASQANTPWLMQVSSVEGPALALTLRPIAADTVGVQHVMVVDAASDVRLRVWSYAVANPMAVALTDATGAHITTLPVVGSAAATQAGSWTVSADQGTSPWVTRASSTGEPQGTLVASVIGQPTVTASIAGTPAVVASVPGQVTVTASVVGQPTVTASVVGVPSVVGSVWATPTGSWTVGVVATSGTTTGLLTVTSDAEGPLLRVHVVGSAGGTSPTSVYAIQQGSWTITANQGGAPWTTVGSIGATQLGAPWTTIASIAGTLVVSAAGQPTVTASVIGQPTVTASVVGIPTVVGSVTASLYATSGSALGALTARSWANGPILRAAVEVGSFAGLTVTSVVGQVTVTASVVGAPRTQPYAAATSAWQAVGSAFVTTSDQQVLAAAPGAGARYYVHALIAVVSSIASVVHLLDGNTVIWRGYCAADGGGFTQTFPYPLRQPTANTSLGFQFTTSGANGFVSVAGFVGA